ncbi:hypothetical protein OH77DRAFT_1383278, partial [Trametes cingulata]
QDFSPSTPRGPSDPDSPPSKRVRIEEVEDDEPGGLPRRPWIEDFPRAAGVSLAHAETAFEKLRRVGEEREDGSARGPWYPFQSKEEWEVARWLLTSGLTQEGIDQYLKL